MKVLMVSGNPRVENFGGVEVHAANLTNYLSQINDIELHVLTYGSKTQELERNSIQFYAFKRLTNRKLIYSLVLPIDLYRLTRKIRKLNPDVVHFQGVHPLYCLAAILCQKKYPTILTMHGILVRETDFHTQTSFILKFFSRLCEKYALAKIKNIIVVAPQIEEIVRKMTNSKIFVIPNGVDLSGILKNDSFDLGRENIVFFIGNFVKLKGIDILIQALPLVKKQIPDAYLLIAGSGPQEEELKRLVKELSLEDNVKFLGFVEGELKYSYFKSANVLVVPSLWESLPIVVLEGMACEKPIIASDVGGIPYLVNDNVNGFLVKAGNVEELAHKITTLLKDKELQKRMGEKGLEKAKEFTWDKIAERTFRVYNEVITGNI